MADNPFATGPTARFPNTRLRGSVHSLDGPTLNTNASHSNADPDTCRICRGEGTPEEPLFYPCRCSGSIKHVHQDCLMEWLSHSQKKHCELCKTPFRFTKLYDPNMPKTLPWHVFVGHMAKYLFTNVLVWLRAVLVFCVWLGGLPYLMRTIWRLLFWVSDEGPGGFWSLTKHQSAWGSHAGQRSGICLPNQDPARQFFTNTTCPAVDLPVPGTAHLAKGALTVGQVSNGNSAWLTFLGFFLGSTDKSTSATNVTTTASSPRTSTLLSGVKFLRDLTRHDWINDKVIEILEGQIVTVVVIVCFILIILVRDYVVQQQPEINMRAAFAAAENVEAQPPPQDQQDDGFSDAEDGEGDSVEALAMDQDNGRLADLLDDDFDKMHWGDRDEGASSSSAPQARREAFPAFEGQAGGRHAGTEFLGQPSRPLFEDKAARIRDAIDHDGPLAKYLVIYREANGDPERILELARERDLEEQLDYWIKLTRTMLDRGPRPPGYESPPPISSSSTETDNDPADIVPYFGPKIKDLTAALEAEIFKDTASSSDAKGKGKAVESDGEHDESLGNLGCRSLRPRANTDGPKVNGHIHPLANNSWSFKNLPQEPAADFTTSKEDGPAQFPQSDESGDQDLQLTPQTSQGAEEDNFRDDFLAAPFEEPLHNTNASDETETTATLPPLPELGRPDAGGADVNGANGEGPAHQPEAVAPAPRRQPVGLLGRVADFMWRDVDEINPADLGLGPDPLIFHEDEDEDEADDDEGDGLGADDAEQDQEVVEAAVAAGLDPEAIEDAEDLEGILELLGMRGPVAGLFQNAIFCAFLVSITVFLGIVIPYNCGRFTVWLAADPMKVVRMFFGFCMLVQDLAMVIFGLGSWAVSLVLQFFTTLLKFTSASAFLAATTAQARSMMVSAINRISGSVLADIFSGSEIQSFSAISHQALLILKDRMALLFAALWLPVDFAVGGDYMNKSSEAVSVVANVTMIAFEGLKELPNILTNPNTWVLNLSPPEPTAATFNAELAHWGATDRFWAIVVGYIAISFAGAMYLRWGSPFFTGPTGQEWEASVIEGLNQASGVMKVILIIGIEMLVFPLYCGMLLDLATLPLFESATIKSRILFTMEYPLTSIFVHWFVGTGYMFHFALFVSMCRKIMRKGVLYFIRDPDDPEFHPVRDVLERSVLTQLRKILFSAFVYGALVMVCLGGVVWGLALSISRVLPIHYTTHEPVLEFPIDLLFYNFLMPLAFRYFKPTDALHAMYTWWFRKCARALRVTWFLFGERRIDEEGRLVLSSDSPDAKLAWWGRLFLEVDANGEHVQAKRWTNVFEGSPAKPTVMPTPQALLMNSPKSQLVSSGQLIPDGRFVRAPASDQVKIPKGRRVFFDVSEGNERPDNSPATVTDIYSSEQYQFVYVPPWFRVRVFLFIIFIWIFAAVTGVGLTIIPLVFGRRMFKALIPDHIRTNDIYAFTIGIHVLGLAAYAIFHLRSIYQATATWAQSAFRTIANGEAVRRVLDTGLRVAKIVYAIFFYYLVFPFLVASLMELYAMIPMHELMYSALLHSGTSASGKAAEAISSQLTTPHTIRVLQAWTIGLLYLQLSTRVITVLFRGSRLSAAVMAIFRRGWLDPDVAVLTRAFVIPGLTIWVSAVVTPLVFAKLAITNGLTDPLFRTTDGGMLTEQDALYHAYRVLIYRLSFPATALGLGILSALLSMISVFRRWKVRIRDEAYLIGERLHNFGAAVHSGTPKGKGTANGNAAWRGGRL